MYGTFPACYQKTPPGECIQKPWKYKIGKTMFHPEELMSDLCILNEVFSQIISDCRDDLACHINAHEREDIVDILRLHGVQLLLPSALENSSEVVDHFSFSDLVMVNVEDDIFLCLCPRNRMTVRLRTIMAHQIKAQIDKGLFGRIEEKFLSFMKGDTIEIVCFYDLCVTCLRLRCKLITYVFFLRLILPPKKNHHLDRGLMRKVTESSPTQPFPCEEVREDVGHMNDHEYTMLEFALTHFRVPKRFEDNHKKNSLFLIAFIKVSFLNM
ncbi:hypothetical protein DICVIV_11840 [Dictyocaulus viviparus]|uniref:Unconventional myosin-XV-like domain-containing protein n=1 Tax=Dictyocaulus viviparus TaxID=29172 RepID=A0A0D8XIP6_DICVI|nr:hypothetical protein DICVIV_11840 [Dictyocaulus viviparus]